MWLVDILVLVGVAVVVRGTPVKLAILSEASRRFILSRRSAFSISGSGRGGEESLFGVT
jgi:hypothetical protein